MMPVQDLNHVNINAPMDLLRRVRDFYVDIIGLQDGWRPDVPVAGYWLYAGEKPVVHLMDASAMAGGPTEPGVTGHLDHIAFTCTDVDAFEAHLEQQGVPFRRRDLPAFDTVQLVVTDPTGLDVELNFSS